MAGVRQTLSCLFVSAFSRFPYVTNGAKRSHDLQQEGRVSTCFDALALVLALSLAFAKCLPPSARGIRRQRANDGGGGGALVPVSSDLKSICLLRRTWRLSRFQLS